MHALLVVDDFAPTGTSSDVARMQREAERLLRAQGNRSGRGRLRADATLRPIKAPRGMILSTGEDIPGSQSVRARMVITEVRTGDVRLERLSSAQADASAGLFASAMAGFLLWLASRLVSARERLRETVLDWRTKSFAHRRYADSIGQLSAGFDLFLRFALEIGAISEEQRLSLQDRASAALLEVAAAQAAYQRAADPVSRFIELIAAAFVSGAAHLADAYDEAESPPDAVRWGWRLRRVQGRRLGEPEAQEVTQPQGRRIGWVRAENVYLEPDAAFAEAQRLAQLQDVPLAVRKETLWSRMDERGLLVSHQAGRFTAQPRIAGNQRRAIHLRADLFTSGTGVEGVSGVDEPKAGSEGPPDTGNDTTTGGLHGVGDGVAARAGEPPSPRDTGDTADPADGAEGGRPSESVGIGRDDPDGMEVF
jgi:hypothetical protein